jgi:uncharacterized protein (TIGR03067 family)
MMAPAEVNSVIDGFLRQRSWPFEAFTMTPSTTLLLACGLFTGFASEDAAKKEQACFEGVWSFALVEVDGKKQPDVPFTTHKVIISKDGSFVVIQGPRITRGLMKLDPTKTPKHFDVTVTNGPAKGRTTLAIYELDGDTYKICSSFRNKDRAAGFDSKPGGGLVFQVLKREKQDLKEALIEAGGQELAATWQALEYTLDGNRAPDEDIKKVKLVIDGQGNAAAYRDGKIFIGGSAKIDPTKNPMTIDVMYTEGDYKGQTGLGIYKIEDDVLTICRAAPDHARPTEFASRPGSGHTLMTYKREMASTK